MKNYNFIQVYYSASSLDSAAQGLQKILTGQFQVTSGKVKSGKLFIIDEKFDTEKILSFAQQALCDQIIQAVSINRPVVPEGYGSSLIIGKLPGVTDDEGVSAAKTMVDFFDIQADESIRIFSQEYYIIENEIPDAILRKAAEDFLCNKLINHISVNITDNGQIFVPEVQLTVDNTVEVIDIQKDEDALVKISDERLLALNAEEMNEVKKYFTDQKTRSIRKKKNLPENPTDCELEIIGQTWSEHCKHKEFNAVIEYTHPDGKVEKVDSLFKTFIRGATEKVRTKLEENGKNWLVKVFTDNAGVVKVNEDALFVWKVETHNSPSAIDPYGGAITGILGNNRDPLGTGVGGAKLLFNTDVLCFGHPSFSGDLLKNQLHPKRIFEGVRKGIEDGGNKSGIPTVNGAIIFDERYSGKPLVYCGTGGILPPRFNNHKSWLKPVSAGDKIISIGGRVGKDGIHGATFSSRELDEHSPQSAVQIGSPIVQKLASDFMVKACAKGLIKTSTDCGAGGLSSAIGELASISNGAIVNLETVKLKYSGLLPWEIFLSESQERMILVVTRQDEKEVSRLAAKMDVEATLIGEFTGDGFLDVRYHGSQVAYLALDFLHDGVPRKYLFAEMTRRSTDKEVLQSESDYNAVVHKLLASDNIASREFVIRQYDHEVKGKTIVKPLMGKTRKAPQDAGVVRLNFTGREAIAVSNGIMPKFVDADPYASSAGAFDEAIRQIIAVGGELPLDSSDPNCFWSVNDNFCVPDSVYNPVSNPDGRHKLAQLVEMCRALYDMSTYFSIPLTSGKDSMKNDFKAGSVKISVPPTILYSAAAKIKDYTKCLTSEFKKPGDLIYQLGKTYLELAGTEYAKLYNHKGGSVPVVRMEDAMRLYKKVSQVNKKKLLRSVHDISDGGMIIAVIESCFGNDYGASIAYTAKTDLPVEAVLFAESHSRFIVSVESENQVEFEKLFGDDAMLLGKVTEDPSLQFTYRDKLILSGDIRELKESWNNGLREQMI
jgi:phosphoribosylformylglycinamidine synthase subunit PurSL